MGLFGPSPNGVRVRHLTPTLYPGRSKPDQSLGRSSLLPRTRKGLPEKMPSAHAREECRLEGAESVGGGGWSYPYSRRGVASQPIEVCFSRTSPTRKGLLSYCWGTRRLTNRKTPLSPPTFFLGGGLLLMVCALVAIHLGCLHSKCACVTGKTVWDCLKEGGGIQHDIEVLICSMKVKMPGKAGASRKIGNKSKQESKLEHCTKTRKRNVDNGDTEDAEKEVRLSTKQMKKQPKNPCQAAKKNTNTKKKTFKNKITWQPLSKDSQEHFEDMMESVILSVLRDEVKEKENIQIHLNCLKERFLQLCEKQKVSLGEWSSLKKVSDLCLKEMETLEANQEDLKLLQEETEKAVKATELIKENIQKLQDKIRILENELEEEEEKAKLVLHIDDTKVLSLPELPKESIEAPILHEEILKRIPNQKDILKDLHVMNNSAEMKNMLTFIKEAYKKLDTS